MILPQGPHGGEGYHLGLIDYSANINPFGIPSWVRKKLIESIDLLKHYPDPSYRQLRIGLARYFSCDPEIIIPGNGASDILKDILACQGVQKVLIPVPSFGEYQRLTLLSGAEVIPFFLDPAQHFRVEAKALWHAALSAKVDTIIIGNPNNPSSQSLAVRELESLIELTAQSGINLIIDEAFLELGIPGQVVSALPFLKHNPQLWVIRAATKVFALPGLRLAYAFCPQAHAQRLRDQQSPWSINALAGALGEIYAQCTEYLQQTQAWLEAEPKRFADTLARLPWLTVVPPQANFILCQIHASPVLNHGGPKLRAFLADQGFLIRDASTFTGLDQSWFRLAVGLAKDNNALFNALSQFPIKA
jgi:threonine-phosphate decarboxylase